MNFRRLIGLPLLPTRELIVAGVLAVSAPLIAAAIHSERVAQRGIRLYQSEILRLSEEPLLWAFFAGPACLTFCVLLPFSTRPLLRWAAWLGTVALWTFLFFNMETASR
jgi:hypothetical protein